MGVGYWESSWLWLEICLWGFKVLSFIWELVSGLVRLLMLNSCCFQVESGLQVDSLTGLVEGEELQLDAVRGQDYTQV